LLLIDFLSLYNYHLKEMTMKKTVMTLALMLAVPAQAEVFKCKIGESKTVYQPTPCANANDAKAIEIKRRSAEKEAKAAEDLKQWQAQHDAAQAAEKAAMQAEHDRVLREAEVAAQQHTAAAERRQAQALEDGKAGTTVVIGR
jgi:hypothetical protein